MKIVVVGLGKMGAQIAERFLGHGHQVVAIDPDPSAVEQIVAKGATKATDRADAVAQFKGEQVVVWLMIPAGLVTQELTAWLEVLPQNSIVIDGGNSDFRDTIKHHDQAVAGQAELIDVGTSGGILGVKNGFSMMVGGSKAAYDLVEPLLLALSQPSGGYRYFGGSGAGHYVKMVHNAIEYGVMESLAEGYRMLKEGPYENLNLADAGAVWQEASIIKSDLNQLAAEAMAENPNLDGIDGYVAESGEARWTLEVANSKNIKLEAIQAAFDVRVASQNGQTDFRTKLLAELRNKFGGHHLNKD